MISHLPSGRQLLRRRGRRQSWTTNLLMVAIILVVETQVYRAVDAFSSSSATITVARQRQLYASRRPTFVVMRSKKSHDDKDKPETRTVEFELLSSIHNVTAECWNSCLVNETTTSKGRRTFSSPFLQHSWLAALEDSQCACGETGWFPAHVCIRLDGDIKGFVPAYIKTHSMGEFIFDQQFAEAAYQNGINYYPKLLVGVPFTPATGERILFHPSVYESYSSSELKQLRQATGKFLREISKYNQLSSVHCNFLTDQEATDLAGPLLTTTADDDDDNRSKDSTADSIREMLMGRFQTVQDDYLRRTSLQYHWINANPKKENTPPFTDFDDYLSCFKSKRRITIRRERSKVLEDEKIRVDAIVGKNILKYDGLVERMFEIYKSTIDKMVWGRQYLTLDFFERLAASDFIDNLCFMCARYRKENDDPASPTEPDDDFCADDVFAGTINIVKNNVFYGRYWGCLPGQEVKNLHFEVCYWSAIDYCIQNGIERMEPGAGGGDYKWARGFDPALIHSVHYICHPGLRRAVAQFLEYETENNVEVTEYLRERSAVAGKRTSAASVTSDAT